MIKKVLVAAATAAVLSTNAMAAEFKVGVVYPGRILSESAPALAAQDKLKSYFQKREEELNGKIQSLRAKAKDLEKNAQILAQADQLKKRQELAELERDIARQQRALIEERNQRAGEESQIILTRANRIIQDIAKKEKFDLILQEAVWASPRVDITEQVIKQLNKPTK